MSSPDSTQGSAKTMYDNFERRSITEQEGEAVREAEEGNENKKRDQVTREKLITTLIICFCNLINFMDRYALPGIDLSTANDASNSLRAFQSAGILPLVISDLKLSNFQGGLLQSAFIVTYVICAPLVGYLADRHSRK